MKTSRTWALAVGCAVLGLGIGFVAGRRDRAQDGPADDTATVATFRGGRVTAAELRAALEEQGALARSQPEARRRILDEVVREKLIERAAAAKGYDRAPEAVRERRRSMVAAYVRGEADDPANRREITDADLQAWLDAHRSEFDQPERVRVADIFVSAPASGPEREKKRREAEAVLREVRAKSARDYYAFATAARSRSDDLSTRAFGGDLPMLSKRELENRLGPEAAESAFALRGIDALAEDVVESPKGFHLIRLRSRIEATRGDVSSLRNVIRTRVGAERRARAEADLYAAIESSADVRVDEAALASAGAQETSAHAGR